MTPKASAAKKMAKALVFLAILLISDQVIGYILRYFYFHQRAGKYQRTTFVIDSTKADILVLGASTASHHYVPEVFQEKFKMSFYNAGRDGNFLFYSYAIFEAVTKRYFPKIIIVNLDARALFYEREDYERLSTLLPYYKDHPELRDIIELRSPVEKYKLYSAIYPFNSQLFRIVDGNLGLLEAGCADHEGYLPLHGKVKNSSVNVDLEEIPGIVDENKMAAVNKMAAFCKKNNIRLVFARSPILIKSKEVSVWKKIQESAESNQCQYLDFSNIFDKHPEYFNNVVHLNDDGAKRYSEIICDVIRRQTSEGLPRGVITDARKGDKSQAGKMAQ